MEKIYGPYDRPDGRKHVIYFDPDTRARRTQSYPRYLMEQHLGRELLPDEHVDYINDDHTDDRLENYQLLSPGDNVRKSNKPAEMLDVVCPQCGNEFKVLACRYRYNQIKRKGSGPYCSRSCAGKGPVR